MGWTGRMMVAALAVALAVGPATASTLRFYTGISIFGDSLSDPGNAAALAGASFPPEFPLGKASDGPLWSEILSAEFTARGLPARNFAFAAARVQPDDADALSGFPGINLPAQLRNFAAATPIPLAPGHLGLFWLGANDLRDALGQFDATGDPIEQLVALQAAADFAANLLVNQAAAVTAFGISDLLFITAPDLSLPPAAATQLPEARVLAQTATGMFNAALAGAVSTLGLTDPALRAGIFDINPGFMATLANPDAFGVTEGVATPCVLPGFVPSAEQLSRCPQHFFYDFIHPSSTLHTAIAADIRTVAAPIPLPAAGWLLLGGLVLLGGLARRRA